MLLWTLCALLFVAIAAIIWRAVGSSMKARAALLRRTWRSLATIGALVIATGAWILYNTTVVNAYTTRDQLNAWKTAYETKYRHTEAEGQPTIAAVEMKVDLEPAALRYRIAGRDQLENRT